MALVPFLLLVIAGLLSLGIVDVVERSSVAPSPPALGDDRRVPAAERSRSDHDLTLPGAPEEDLRGQALPASVVEPRLGPPGALAPPPAEPETAPALPSVDAGPVIVPEPHTALLVVGGLALLRALDRFASPRA